MKYRVLFDFIWKYVSRMFRRELLYVAFVCNLTKYITVSCLSVYEHVGGITT